MVTASEECDDAGTADGDGCSSTCTVETGYVCSGTLSVCVTDCGDGLRVGDENCDDGVASGTAGCLADCSGAVDGYTCTGGDSTTADT